MEKHNYHADITVNATSEEAFESINNVSAWWTINVEGHSGKLNDVFTVRFGETFISTKIVELIPYKKIRWQVIDCYKHWLRNKKEWNNTTMVWEITAEKNATHINFTHIGLVPGIECYNSCEKAWNFYVKESLFKLLTGRKGIPELT